MPKKEKLKIVNILRTFCMDRKWRTTHEKKCLHVILHFIIYQSFKLQCVLTCEKISKYASNCRHRISRPEVNFTKLVHVTLDLISVYNIYKFQIDHLKNKRDLGHRKSRKWKVFRRLPEVDKSVSGRSNIFWYYKRDLLNWYRLNFKRKILKISISTITSCDDRKWRLTRSTP